MLRICGGEWKGHVIKAPSGSETRPTSSFLREAIFNTLINGMGHAPCRVLDLFAGSGALGLEALSYGAESALFVESSKNALKALEQNLNKVAQSRETHVIKEGDLLKWNLLIKRQRDFLPFDTIFCDPPYRKNFIHKAMRALDDDALWGDETLWVAEMAPDEALEHDKWQKIKEKTHGDSKVVIFKRLK
ncbi:MAG: 16S rRNA (guanine(966)-N(2))-methyltransferase RsmD [Bdellovibrionota bacterium]